MPSLPDFLELLGEETIPEVMERRAAAQPDHVYCWFEGVAWRFGRMNTAANRLARALLESGLKLGDRVAVMLPSHPDHVIAIAALMKAGLVRVPINTHYKGIALAQAFEQYKPHALVVDEAYRSQVAPILEGPHCPAFVAWRGQGGTFDAMCREGSDMSPTMRATPDAILALTPSSGTTGASKGVLKSDRTLRAGPVGIRLLTDMRDGDVFLLWEPLHHGAGVAVAIAALLWPISLAMVERFSASRFWEDVRRYGVTHIHYLGGVLPLLLKQVPTAEDKNHRVRIAWGGGCPPDIWDAFVRRFGVTMREGYGLSEMITFVTINTGGLVGSIGKSLPCFEVRLGDDHGAPVGLGETGEILVRSLAPGLEFLGYYDNPAASASTMRDAWCCTGDLARADASGFLYFAGRKKDVIRRRGVNIAAWEVERVIALHEDIQECALVAVPSELGEDELKLFIRPKPDTRIDPMAFIRWCEPRLPYFQVPRYIAFIDEFPKTPTQRIRKAELPRDVNCWDLEKTGYVIDRGRVAPN